MGPKPFDKADGMLSNWIFIPILQKLTVSVNFQNWKVTYLSTFERTLFWPFWISMYFGRTWPFWLLLPTLLWVVDPAPQTVATVALRTSGCWWFFWCKKTRYEGNSNTKWELFFRLTMIWYLDTAQNAETIDDWTGGAEHDLKHFAFWKDGMLSHDSSRGIRYTPNPFWFSPYLAPGWLVWLFGHDIVEGASCLSTWVPCVAKHRTESSRRLNSTARVRLPLVAKPWNAWDSMRFQFGTWQW